jgi:ribA/ribD-fused uncharacterized protein
MIDRFEGDYAFLSNFWPCTIEYDGVKYPSSEHAFQAAKSDDELTKLRIAKTATPGDAKRLGRIIKLRPGWDDERLQVMHDILRIKFSDPELRLLLLATKQKRLIEGNNWGDSYWGVCNGRGSNHLGTLLMKVRNEIRESKKSAGSGTR